MFDKRSPGSLVPIQGTHPTLGAWAYSAFVPDPLAGDAPSLSGSTYLAVGNARAALAALDSTTRQLPNPTLLRSPTLRQEAQSTSELEGTYSPLRDVLTADEDDPDTAELVEVLNYVRMANAGFDAIARGQGLSPAFLSELQGVLMRGSPLHAVSGRLRDTQVVIGVRSDADLTGMPIEAARFVPAPPGIALETGVSDLIAWMRADHSDRIDPVVAAAMSHYQFETLHPFRDGNGRLGRYLIVVQLLTSGVLSEPTLTVSPWFEARRAEYYDRLLRVSAAGDWDGFVSFFAEGLRSAADLTRRQMVALVAVQGELKDRLRGAGVRAETTHAVVDFAIANPSFTVRSVERALGLSYQRANKIIRQLVELDILMELDPTAYRRRFVAPRVIDLLTAR